ncbi:MAG: type II toxin-antitoxin system RelE/ParE family toxin [Pyrinomonadaceae bacterium]|nr:type II toxin-antitoxin system RelE/ParE family toxin [Pyrinomonadaceae bacterium]
MNFKPAALRQIQRLSKSDQKRISRKIETPADNPLPDGVKKLAGEEGFYRVRVGDYRIIYTIDGEKMIVLVITIGHRREIYRR